MDSSMQKPNYILLSEQLTILRAPPTFPHLEYGELYLLEDGRDTFFHPPTDFLLWDGRTRGLGQIAAVVQNIVIPANVLCDYTLAYETFGFLYADGALGSLKNIYVDLSSKFFVLKDAITTLGIFDPTSTIIAPDLEEYNELVGVIDSSVPILPSKMAECWVEHSLLALEGSQEKRNWVDFIGEALHGWTSTMAKLSHEIHDSETDDFDDGLLMHPSGISWLEYIEINAPNFIPTYTVTRFSERDRIQGTVYEGCALLPEGYNLSETENWSPM
ncbi:hypothetical protein M426DRAFT_28417 [Hypoxylon sp. CI-4A]|nr:hypothetical protein M426DRAFT_28417 [Hypoxylon sp. CI-4A]